MELAPALPPDGDPARISAHLVDELRHELEQQRLIVQSSIRLHLAVLALVRQRLHVIPGQLSERAQPVIAGNVDGLVAGSCHDGLPRVERDAGVLPLAAEYEAAAVDPDDDGQLVYRLTVVIEVVDGRVDIKAQAVLTLRHTVSRDVDAGNVGRAVTSLGLDARIDG